MASTIHFSSAAPSAVPAQQFRLRTRSFVHSRHKLSWRSTTKRISAVASDADEIALLEKMLKLARERKERRKRTVLGVSDRCCEKVSNRKDSKHQ